MSTGSAPFGSYVICMLWFVWRGYTFISLVELFSICNIESDREGSNTLSPPRFLRIPAYFFSEGQTPKSPMGGGGVPDPGRVGG